MGVVFIPFQPMKNYIDLLINSIPSGQYKSLAARESELHPWYPIFPFNPPCEDFYLPPKGELLLMEGCCSLRKLADAVGFSTHLKGDNKHDINMDLGYPRSKLMLLGDKEIIRGTRLNYICIPPGKCKEDCVCTINMEYSLDEDNDGFFDAIDGRVLRSPGR